VHRPTAVSLDNTFFEFVLTLVEIFRNERLGHLVNLVDDFAVPKQKPRRDIVDRLEHGHEVRVHGLLILEKVVVLTSHLVEFFRTHFPKSEDGPFSEKHVFGSKGLLQCEMSAVFFISQMHGENFPLDINLEFCTHFFDTIVKVSIMDIKLIFGCGKGCFAVFQIGIQLGFAAGIVDGFHGRRGFNHHPGHGVKSGALGMRKFRNYLMLFIVRHSKSAIFGFRKHVKLILQKGFGHNDHIRRDVVIQRIGTHGANVEKLEDFPFGFFLEGSFAKCFPIFAIKHTLSFGRDKFLNLRRPLLAQIRRHHHNRRLE